MHLVVLGRFGMMIQVIVVGRTLMFSAISKAAELLLVKSAEGAGGMQRATSVTVWANLDHIHVCLCLKGVILGTRVIDTQNCSLVLHEWHSNVLCVVCL